jgi:hypothetical protein
MKTAGAAVEPISPSDLEAIYRQHEPENRARAERARLIKDAYEQRLKAMNPVRRYLSTGVRSEVERALTMVATAGLAVAGVSLGVFGLGAPLLLGAIIGARKLMMSPDSLPMS